MVAEWFNPWDFNTSIFVWSVNVFVCPILLSQHKHTFCCISSSPDTLFAIHLPKYLIFPFYGSFLNNCILHILHINLSVFVFFVVFLQTYCVGFAYKMFLLCLFTIMYITYIIGKIYIFKASITKIQRFSRSLQKQNTVVLVVVIILLCRKYLFICWKQCFAQYYWILFWKIAFCFSLFFFSFFNLLEN